MYKRTLGAAVLILLLMAPAATGLAGTDHYERKRGDRIHASGHGWRVEIDDEDFESIAEMLEELDHEIGPNIEEAVEVALEALHDLDLDLDIDFDIDFETDEDRVRIRSTDLGDLSGLGRSIERMVERLTDGGDWMDDTHRFDRFRYRSRDADDERRELERELRGLERKMQRLERRLERLID